MATMWRWSVCDHGVRNQIVETRLVDRHLPGIEPRDLYRILVDAVHIVVEIGKACPENEAGIARSHRRDSHKSSYPKIAFSGKNRKI